MKKAAKKMTEAEADAINILSKMTEVAESAHGKRDERVSAGG